MTTPTPMDQEIREKHRKDIASMSKDLKPISKEDFSNPTKDQKKDIKKLESRDGKISFNKYKEEEIPKRYVQKFSNREFLAESVLIGGFPFFLVARNGKVVIQDQIPFPDIILKPLEFTSYVNKPYCFNSRKEIEDYLNENKTLDSIYRKIKPIWKKYIDADDFHLSICAADTIFTYFQDKIGLTHYLFFVGNNASGKSNNLRIFQQLGYRNMTSTDITAANIYQFLGSEQEGIGTICEDEADNIDEDRDKMRIYKNGYTTGYPILRTDTNYGRKQYRFYTFCFKAFAAEKSPDSLKAKGFNQRIIELYCVYGVPPYDISEVINPAGEKVYQALVDELEETRNELLIYRLMHYHDSLPDIKLFLQNREKQLFKPLLRVFQNTETLKELLPIVSNYVGKKRQSNSNSYHAFLYRAVIELIKSNGEVIIDSSEIITKIKEDLNGEYVIGKPQTFISQEFGELSHKNIIQTLKDIFGATKPNRHGNTRQLIFDKLKLEKLGQIYELDVDVKVIQDGTHGTHGTHSSIIPGVMDSIVGEGNGDSKGEKDENSVIKEVITEELQSQPSSKVSAQPSNASQASQASQAEETNPSTIMNCPTCPYTAEPYWMRLHQCEGNGRTKTV